MIGIPRVTRSHLLVPLASRGPDALAQQAIVFEIVHRFEQGEPDHALQQEVRQHPDAQPEDHGRPERGGEQPRVQHVVPRPKRVLAQARMASRFELPRTAQGARHGAWPEPVERLPQSAAGRVVRRGDAHVMAAVVFDVEVAVPALGEGDLGQPALHTFLFVAEFVGGVDAEATDATHRDGEAEAFGDRQVTAGDGAEGNDEAGVLQRQKEIRNPPVVAVSLERGHHLCRRVGPVEAHDEVDQRDHAKHDQRAKPEPEARTGDRVEPQGQKRQERHGQRHGPEIPLVIGPDDRRHDRQLIVPCRGRGCGTERRRPSRVRIGRRHSGHGDIRGDASLWNPPSNVKPRRLLRTIARGVRRWRSPPNPFMTASAQAPAST